VLRTFALRRGVAATSLAALALAAAACSSSTGGTSSSGKSGGSSSAPASGSSAKSGRIALLLPETKTARYEAADRPFFEAKMKQLCPSCTVDYNNANQDTTTQQQQADAALTAGDKVLVLDPVDSNAAAAIANKAKAKGVPVVSYDRLIKGAPIDVYISFDNVKVGELQGQALLQGMQKQNAGPNPTIVMINGSPTDNNASLFKKGAHSVLDGKVKIAAEYDTPDWSPDKAQSEMDQAITSVGKANIKGVYSANDGMAGGIIAAMQHAGFTSPFPPVTGQDAELAGLQRIIAGTQYMTVYKAIEPEASKAAELAYELLQGQKPSGTNGTTNNGAMDVPSVLLQPVAVTKDNIKDTVVKDGFAKISQLCTGEFAAACAKLALS
jgi:D-xylose transport system substrate-binding protein